MARRAGTIKNRINDSIAYLVVDSGTFSLGSGPAGKLRAEYIARSMQSIGYDAVLIGMADLMVGESNLTELGVTYDIPYISSNLYLAEEGKPYTDRYKVLSARFGSGWVDSRWKFRIGVFGITRPTMMETISWGEGRAFIVRDPIECAREMVQTLQGTCDLILMLSDLERQQLNELLSEVQGIDVAVGGQGFTAKPIVIEGCVVVEPGQRGRTIGDVTLFYHQGSLDEATGTYVTLDASQPEDPAMIPLVEEFLKKMEEIGISTRKGQR
jgi:2',3'-cyclic-nucleotide 2'-phosphodiesterase (5'-nucleotidase family)